MVSANSAPGSRTQTMSTKTVGEGQKLLEQTDRTKSLSSLYGATAGGKVPEPLVNVKGPAVSGKPGDISAESFQKSAFYS
jgi:hypothetical protein